MLFLAPLTCLTPASAATQADGSTGSYKSVQGIVNDIVTTSGLQSNFTLVTIGFVAQRLERQSYPK